MNTDTNIVFAGLNCGNKKLNVMPINNSQTTSAPIM